MLKQITIVFLFSWAATQLSAQTLRENEFVRYVKEDGLSSSNISGIAQDSTGYLWVSTYAGLNRFNGTNFVQFHSTNDTSSIASELLKGVVWLDNQRLGFLSTGLHIINIKTGEKRNVFIPYHNKLFEYKFNMIEDALSDNEGGTLILSRTGLYHFDKNYKLIFRFDYYPESEVPVGHLFFGREVFELDNDRYMITSVGGVFIYNKKRRECRRMTPEDCPLLGEFLGYPTIPFKFFGEKKRCFIIINSRVDSVVYVDLNRNKKVSTKQDPYFSPLFNEFHYRSKFIAVSDTVGYVTGHFSGFHKVKIDQQSGKVLINPEKSFPSYLCTSLLQDREGNLWVGTTKGLFREDDIAIRVQQASIPTTIKDSFPNILFDDIYVSRDKVYAGTKGSAGLMIYDKKNFKFITHKEIQNPSLSRNVVTIYAIKPLDSSTLILATDGPVFLYDTKRNKEKEITPPGWNRPYDWTSEMMKARDGSIWLTSRNIYQYNYAANKFSMIPEEVQKISKIVLPFAIAEDADGNVWMGGHGLRRYNTKLNSFDIMVDSFPFIKMSDKEISALAVESNARKVWFNSYNNGLICYNTDTRMFMHFTRNDGLPDNNIGALIIIGQKLWMTGWSGGIACMDLRTLQITNFGKEDGFPDMPIVNAARFYYDSTEQLLYLGLSDAIIRFDPYDVLRKNPSPHVFVEELVINGRKTNAGTGETISTPYNRNDIMLTIGSINFANNSSQRFAYRILKDSHTEWQQLGVQPSFSISNLSPGRYKIQIKSFSLTNRWPEQVKELDIVVLPPFWRTAWFVIPMALLLLGLLYLLLQWRTGLVRKKEMEKTHVEKLKADNYKSQFELEQISNYFSSSLSGKKTEEEVLWDVAKNLIGRMNYVDCMIYLWNEDKTMMVQKAAYGPKGDPAFISEKRFDVLPGQGVVGHVIETCQPILIPDTRKDNRYRVDDSFRLSEICVPIMHDGELLGIIDSEHPELDYFKERDIKILTTIATLIGNKIKQIESEQSLEVKKEELASINEQLAEAQLSALQGQMNPHFVFNALNSIKRMILDGDNEKASRYLSKFALMIRMTLNHSKDSLVTLRENIEYLRSYLEMEQLRFDDSFSYLITVDEAIDVTETTIPSMMIQPLVENAIWHGLMQIEGEKKVKIGFKIDHNKITCNIEDNGIGIKQAKKLKELHRPLHRSVGLGNLQKRIHIMNEKYDADCSLEITDMQDIDKSKRGTLVVLRFNVLNQ